MKRLFVLFFAVLLVVSTVTTPNASAANSTQSRRMIVIFADGKVNKDIILKANGKINKELNSLNALAVTLPENMIDVLANTPGVIKVEPDFIVTASGKPAPPTPVIPDDWGIQRINAPAAWSSGNTGKGVKIAVLDTGIAAHTDLADLSGVSIVNYTESYLDDNGHGTHVAGIIAAKNDFTGVVGVAPGAQLFAVKVLDGNGSGYLSDVVKGIEWATLNHMDIINMSLGSPNKSLTLETAVNAAYNSGVLLVAAAGNSGGANTSKNNVEYPAKYASVIAVAATSSDINNTRASFSSTGLEVEVSAPGVNIKSTYLNNSYATMSGTSMATPMVAGDLALLIEANSKLVAPLTISELRLQVLDKRVKDLGTFGRDKLYGYGLIQAAN